MDRNLTKITVTMFFLSLILLSIIKIEDTDTWVHLSIGREIFNLHNLPTTQTFVYPSLGQEFRYASPIFGMLFYSVYLLFGYAGIVLLKSAIVTTAGLILYKDATSPRNEPLLAVAVLTLFILLSRGRFVERPDIIMMVLLSFVVYALNSYMYHNKNYLYALPVVATIWAGSHSSIVLIFVPFVAFIAGGLIQIKIQDRWQCPSAALTLGQIKVIAAVFAASIAATFINPYPLSQYTLGYGALTMKWGKQYIVELGSMSATENALLWLVIMLTALSFVLNRKHFQFVHLLLVMPFFVLPFTARRFLFLPILLAAPVIARNFALFLADNRNGRYAKTLRRPATVAVIIAWICSYTALALCGIHPLGSDYKIFGIGVNEFRIPAGAVRYMDQNGVYGRTFNPFHWGGYIIWTGYPRRTVFVDPMGGLSERLLEQFSLASSGLMGNTWMLEQLYSTYGFEAVILDYQSRNEGEKSSTGLVLTDPNWALVYWDDSALLYLRRGGRYKELVSRDEYRFVVPAAGRKAISEHPKDMVTMVRIENDLIRAIRTAPSATGHSLLGHLYSTSGRYNLAIQKFSKILEYPRMVDRLAAYTGLGTVYYRLKDMPTAADYYERAVRIQADGTFLYNLATIYVAMGDDRKALNALKKAVKADPGLETARALLVETNKRLGTK